MPIGGGSIEPGAMPLLHKYLGTPVLTFLCRLLFRAPITDINSGMRGVRLSAFNDLHVVSTGMEFSSEIVLQMARRNFRISEVPITLRKDRRDRAPHLRTWRDGWRHLCILLVYSPRFLFLMPGAILSLTGFAFLILLATTDQLALGGIRLSTNTRIVSSLITLVGTQIFSLGLLAKYIAHTQNLYDSRPEFIDRLQTFCRYWAIPLGVIFLLCGGIGVLSALWSWKQHGFGSFLSAHADRFLAPTATVSLIGFQLIATAFFIMLLDVLRRR